MPKDLNETEIKKISAQVLAELGFDIDVQDLNDDIIANFLDSSAEHELMKRIAEARSITVEKVQSYKDSLFDAFRKLHPSKEHMLIFQKEIEEGTLNGTNYCDCIIGKIYRLQQNEKLTFYVDGAPEPIEEFIINVKDKKPSESVEVEAVYNWAKEYIALNY